MREVADWDLEQEAKVLNWPLRDLFLTAVAMRKEAAIQYYRSQCQLWAALAPHQKRASKPPELPEILKE